MANCTKIGFAAQRFESLVLLKGRYHLTHPSQAVLLAHIEGVLHEGIDIALDDPPSRVREQEFQTRGVLSAEMLRRLDAVIDYARGALPGLDLTDLSKERKDEDETVSCG